VAARRAIVILDDGAFGELPIGDTIAGSGSSATLIAAMTVPGHRVIMSDENGYGVLADPNADGYLFFGISTSGANTGDPFIVSLDGVIIEPTWNWTPRAPLFVTSNGLLTETPPTTGVSQVVAMALTATSLLISPQPPILLA
jgi:hypothetical protein